MEELEKKEEERINFNELEKEGFIKQRQEGLFSVRVRPNSGMFNPEQLTKIAELAKLYGEGLAHLTVRQEVEVPGIKHKDINLFREGLVSSGLSVSKGGFSVRAVVSCPGVKWCARSWIDSVAVAEAIDKEFYGKEQFAKLASKFETGVSGCMNSCGRSQENDVGFYGQVEPEYIREKCIRCGVCERICPTEAIKLHPRKKTVSLDESKCIFCGLCILNCDNSAWQAKRTGLAMCAGGKWGRFPQLGKKIANFLSDKQAIYAVAKTLEFYAREAKKGERLANVLNRMGVEKLRQEITS